MAVRGSSKAPWWTDAPDFEQRPFFELEGFAATPKVEEGPDPGRIEYQDPFEARLGPQEAHV